MASHHITAWVGEPQWVVETIRIPVIGLGVLFILYNYVGREHTADERVVQSSVHVDESEVVVVLAHGVAAVEGGGGVVVG